PSLQAWRNTISPGSSMCSFKRRPGRLRQHLQRAGLELKPAHPSSQQVEDVVYDMGRDYDVMNRQREGVVGGGIIKRWRYGVHSDRLGRSGRGRKDGRVSCNRDVLVRERKGLFHRVKGKRGWVCH